MFSTGFNSQVFGARFIINLSKNCNVVFETNGNDRLTILKCTDKIFTIEMMQEIKKHFPNIKLDYIKLGENVDLIDEFVNKKYHVYKDYETIPDSTDLSSEVSSVSSDNSYKEKHHKETKPRKVKKQGTGRGYIKKSSNKLWTQDDIERLRKEFDDRYVAGTSENGIQAISEILFKNGMFPGRTVVAIRRAIERYIIGYDRLNK